MNEKHPKPRPDYSKALEEVCLQLATHLLTYKNTKTNIQNARPKAQRQQTEPVDIGAALSSYPVNEHNVLVRQSPESHLPN